ncbi:type I pantothenate kinase [Agrilactobacillus yilanensis]|uniref:Pantothenate kinase n=1 Tax=Agrilactobacillus yilanensis TaxID=2485997 RepID=A0ABW4J5J2_9LACO|nr:type I pantothenate kinase [Agrilactobacillus yilanensis]
MDSNETYDVFDRKDWQRFHGRLGTNHITQQELAQVKALNDNVSLEDVQVIYAPLRHLIHIYLNQYQQQRTAVSDFLNHPRRHVPFVIGIAGSVAVGKSTTARLLKLLLSRSYPNYKVQQITTDGFLYPNAELTRRGILDRKGFPESYDMEALINFMNAVKSDKPQVLAPKYSHQVYDIIPDQYDVVDRPDILIVEGINVLQLPSNAPIYVSDFFDFSIYVDADPKLVEQWYLERFGVLLDTAFTDPDNYYYQYAIGDRKAAFDMAKKVWRDVNLKNLRAYILPTRSRADLILHKSAHHLIDQVYLRKF